MYWILGVWGYVFFFNCSFPLRANFSQSLTGSPRRALPVLLESQLEGRQVLGCGGVEQQSFGEMGLGVLFRLLVLHVTRSCSQPDVFCAK